MNNVRIYLDFKNNVYPLKYIEIVFLSFLTATCTPDGGAAHAALQKRIPVTDALPSQIISAGQTVETRFPVPAGFLRLPADSGSFAAYLRRFPLHPDSHPVHLHDGSLKNRQDVHVAVLNLDVGKRDLQQCADAVMRLRAEYLFHQKRYADIHFDFTNGFRADYARWRRGERIRVAGNHAHWVPGTAPSGNYAAFRQYLDMVFSYAGTASLARELEPADPATIQPGDVWIHGGHPGHAVIVLDVAENPKSGERRFLLAQSYMPAQEIHVLRNPAGESPWYAVPGTGEQLDTPEWTFEREQLRRFRK
jgi:hypothetical protein